METQLLLPASRRIILAVAYIAAELGRERVPQPRQLFGLSVAVVESADNLAALDLAQDACAALLEELPAGNSCERCRGQLQAIKEFAWLLGRAQTGKTAATSQEE